MIHSNSSFNNHTGNNVHVPYKILMELIFKLLKILGPFQIKISKFALYISIDIRTLFSKY